MIGQEGGGDFDAGQTRALARMEELPGEGFCSIEAATQFDVNSAEMAAATIAAGAM
jgi:hypothetical protein